MSLRNNYVAPRRGFYVVRNFQMVKHDKITFNGIGRIRGFITFLRILQRICGRITSREM